MTRYFFDVVTDGDVDLDDEGMLLPNMAAARREASLSLTDLAREEFLSERPVLRLAISVRTVDGPVGEAAIQWDRNCLH